MNRYFVYLNWWEMHISHWLARLRLTQSRDNPFLTRKPMDGRFVVCISCHPTIHPVGTRLWSTSINHICPSRNVANSNSDKCLSFPLHAKITLPFADSVRVKRHFFALPLFSLKILKSKSCRSMMMQRLVHWHYRAPVNNRAVLIV